VDELEATLKKTMRSDFKQFLGQREILMRLLQWKANTGDKNQSSAQNHPKAAVTRNQQEPVAIVAVNDPVPEPTSPDRNQITH
jgi:hypothetical protein